MAVDAHPTPRARTEPSGCPAGAGEDDGMDHGKHRLRFPYDSTVLRPHCLHSHPYVMSARVTHGGPAGCGVGRAEFAALDAELSHGVFPCSGLLALLAAGAHASARAVTQSVARQILEHGRCRQVCSADIPTDIAADTAADISTDMLSPCQIAADLLRCMNDCLCGGVVWRNAVPILSCLVEETHRRTAFGRSMGAVTNVDRVFSPADQRVPPPRHNYGDRNSGLADIYLRVGELVSVLIVTTRRSRCCST
eukprot:COSAG01_NODE_3715_length_5769_cov_2.903175_7_plen_251_part_00